MSSDLTTAAADLEEFLNAAVPAGWKVTNAEALGKSKTTGVVLTYEQLDISQTADSQDLPEGWVWVTFQTVLSVPETNAVKAMARLTPAAGKLLQIFDASPDLRWGPDATRTRLDTGESAFVIPLAVLASNSPPAPPTPEPDAVPDESKED